MIELLTKLGAAGHCRVVMAAIHDTDPRTGILAIHSSELPIGSGAMENRPDTCFVWVTFLGAATLMRLQDGHPAN